MGFISTLDNYINKPDDEQREIIFPVICALRGSCRLQDYMCRHGSGVLGLCSGARSLKSKALSALWKEKATRALTLQPSIDSNTTSQYPNLSIKGFERSADQENMEVFWAAPPVSRYVQNTACNNADRSIGQFLILTGQNAHSRNSCRLTTRPRPTPLRPTGHILLTVDPEVSP